METKMGLIPPGRPKGPPKSRKLWMGQHPKWVLNAIIAYTTPQERFERIWPLVEERSNIIYDQYAKTHDEDGDTYVPPVYIDDIESLLLALGDLPDKICRQAASSPCFANDTIEYTHWAEEAWAGWTVLIGNLGFIRLLIQLDSHGDCTWKFLVQRNDGYVVSAYKKGKYEENECELQEIVKDLEPLLTVQISPDTYRQLRREA